MKRMTIHDLMSIEIHVDTGDEDEESQWFPLFVKTPNGISCQFNNDGELDFKSKLRIKTK